MDFGAQVLAAGGTRFRVWAPGARRAEVLLEPGAAHAMQAQAGGWHEAVIAEAGAGTRYRYRFDGGVPVPDPASRCNPEDVHGPSEVIDPGAYAWQDAAWRGRPWHEAVLYELHVGSFTPAGTFAAAAERLAELAALGITAIALMPLADVPGGRNWGYDGVLPFAPESSYGRPDELRAFVDCAHALGLMVLVDVVYNHFGPDGNYLHGYCPEFFNPAHQTPWGAAINFDGPHSAAVRAFFVANALYWTLEFHCDGLRLDAVHQIRDDSPLPIVEEIAQALAQAVAREGRQRHVHLVLENERNEARRLAPAGLATAQWNDDLHNAAHVLLTGETEGYYADYAQAPAQLLGQALAEGYVYQGQVSPHLGVPRGEPSAALPPTAFVSFLQNHDQVGNRAMGERLDRLADARKLEALYACLLLSPQIPMLFMGEEFAASTPFLFFCDFEGALAEAVRQGRRAEFRRFAAFADEAARARIPDPNAEATFAQSKLRWAERETSPHRERLALMRRLLQLRHQHLVPRLGGAPGGGRSLRAGGVVHVVWPLAGGARWELQANLQDSAAALPAGGPASGGQRIYVSHAETGMPPWSVRVNLFTA